MELTAPGGGAALGARRTAELTVHDDEGCVADDTHLCLNDGRFQVSIDWRTAEQRSGPGRAVPFSGDTGAFWFFSPENLEIFVKVLDACVPPFDHYWVFIAGLTDVETRMTVLDTVSGEVRHYDHALKTPFEPVNDVQAFDTCP